MQKKNSKSSKKKYKNTAIAVLAPVIKINSLLPSSHDGIKSASQNAPHGYNQARNIIIVSKFFFFFSRLVSLSLILNTKQYHKKVVIFI